MQHRTLLAVARAAVVAFVMVAGCGTPASPDDSASEDIEAHDTAGNITTSAPQTIIVVGCE